MTETTQTRVSSTMLRLIFQVDPVQGRAGTKIVYAFGESGLLVPTPQKRSPSISDLRNRLSDLNHLINVIRWTEIGIAHLYTHRGPQNEGQLWAMREVDTAENVLALQGLATGASGSSVFAPQTYDEYTSPDQTGWDVENITMNSPMELIVAISGTTAIMVAGLHFSGVRLISLHNSLQRARVERARADYQVACYEALSEKVQDVRGRLNTADLLQMDENYTPELPAASRALAALETVERTEG